MGFQHNKNRRRRAAMRTLPLIPPKFDDSLQQFISDMVKDAEARELRIAEILGLEKGNKAQQLMVGPRVADTFLTGIPTAPRIAERPSYFPTIILNPQMPPDMVAVYGPTADCPQPKLLKMLRVTNLPPIPDRYKEAQQ